LRNQWGFDGFVLSDFIFGLRDAALSLKNGLDIEAPFTQQHGMHLRAALESGGLRWSDVDIACTRILRKELEFAAKTAASQPDPLVVFCEEHKALAREAAARSVVLLKNESVKNMPLLPLDPSRISKVAVVGRLGKNPPIAYRSRIDAWIVRYRSRIGIDRFKMRMFSQDIHFFDRFFLLTFYSPPESSFAPLITQESIMTS
jgi:beta-glucosidase-like glycosyl hydrolase